MEADSSLMGFANADICLFVSAATHIKAVKDFSLLLRQCLFTEQASVQLLCFLDKQSRSLGGFVIRKMNGVLNS